MRSWIRRGCHKSSQKRFNEMDGSFNQLLSPYGIPPQPQMNPNMLLQQGYASFLDPSFMLAANKNRSASEADLLEEVKRQIRQQNLKAFTRRGGGTEEWQNLGSSDVSPFSADEFRNRGYDIDYLRSILMRQAPGSFGV